MWHVISDYQPASAVSSLALRRTYNSTPLTWKPLIGQYYFGANWTTGYGATIRRAIGVLPGKVECWRFSDGTLDCTGPYIAAETAWTGATIHRPDGKSYQFQRVGDSWTSAANVNGRLNSVLGVDNVTLIGFDYVDQSGDVTERFDQNGTLLWKTYRNGLVERLTYSDGVSNDSAVNRYPTSAPVCSVTQDGPLLPAGRLMCVTDHFGRQLQFSYDTKGRVNKMLDPANESYLYEYDGASGGCVPGNQATFACAANNLTKVTYPGGKSHTYFYNEIARINGGAPCDSRMATIGNGFGQFPELMTGLVDENGVRQINWTYDCKSRATSSAEANGVNEVNMAYTDVTSTNTRTTTVTHTLGTAAAPKSTTRTFSTKFVLGIGVNTGVDQPCVECGTIKSRTYDANGNIDTTTDFNGAVTKYGYNLDRNLEISRTEAFGTPQARTVSTEWEPAFRLVRVVAGPKLITRYTYDANGNTRSRTDQPTSDANGGQAFNASPAGPALTTEYTYNSLGQIETVTGPRTDLVDRTNYEYELASGNLTSVTNAMGQKTVLSNYDPHGRVGRISAPNGVVTELTYKPRGWLESRTVIAGGIRRTTSYSYDDVGQLKKVTMPDATSITYTYDDARRLTGIADNDGKSITYTLDLVGNRKSEEVKDPNGVLTQRVAREFDVLSRLEKQTGAAQ
jgi:YD repeat-containing protein